MSIFQPTDEQQRALDEQLAAKPSDRRVGVPLTPEQTAAYRQAVEEELGGKDEMVAHVRKLRAAEQEPGLFGDLRRAINASHLSREQIAQRIGTSSRELDEFRTGAAPLPPESLRQLANVLGLRLMQEIPAAREPLTTN
jgi:ribosome-binding protein aMBF1 (putative translation factor)